MLKDCPMNDFTCPYFNADEGICGMWDTGDDPRKECDAYFDYEEEDE